MHLKIQLPKHLGGFRSLQTDNYPFSQSFGDYLGLICHLGLTHSMLIEDLIGCIEDKVFEGRRLPDILGGEEEVSTQIQVENPEVESYYIWNKEQGTSYKRTTLYIARLTLRLAVDYGTSLFRLAHIIQESMEGTQTKKRRTVSRKTTEHPVSVSKMAEDSIQNAAEPPVSVSKTAEDSTPAEESRQAWTGGFRVSSRALEKASAPVPAKETAPSAGIVTARESAQAAKAAIKELQELTKDSIVETNPLLSQFGGV